MTLRALVVLFIALAVRLGAQDLTALAANARQSVFLIKVYDGSGLPSSGTGFLIGNGLVATNYHVIEGAHRVEAVAADESVLAVRSLVASDPANDLALLALAAPVPAPALQLAARRVVQPGERIIVLGSPLGLSGSLSEGIVSALRPRGLTEASAGLPDHPLLQISAPISPGSSGSPVMDLSGQVIGVAVSQLRLGQNLNFAVPVTLLASLARSARPEAPLQHYGKATDLTRPSETSSSRPCCSPLCSLPSRASDDAAA